MKNLIRYLFIFTILFIFNNCSKKEENNISANEEKLTKFSLKQFSHDFSLTLTGETAEITENKNVKISSPSFSLKTTSEIIEIKTDKEGKGEVKVDPDTQKVKEIVITGKVSIVYKDKKEEKITMEIFCGKLTYIDSKKEMIFEEKPIIKRGKNTFSGERIIYNLDKNTIEIKGNVNVEIYPEEKSNN